MAAGWSPLGLGVIKPGHFREMLRIVWENRDNLGYAWRILTRGVCDGCALGTSGLKDWTVKGTHLCLVRLNLLRLNTMGAMDPKCLENVAKLKKLNSRELRELGRLSHPMRRRAGEVGFQRVTWKETMTEISNRWRQADQKQTAAFVTSRGITNETYYAAQKAMRFLGSAHVDNSARLCHSPSTAGLKSTIGVAATTCSYRDWYDADVIIFFGSNPANDQPVSLKYLLEAKRRGTRVLEVNAMREPGMKRYWVPSDPISAVFGTKIVDRSWLVRIGGDLAFLHAVQKILLQRDCWNRDFVAEATVGFEEWREVLEAQDLNTLLKQAGTTLEQAEALADEIESADKGVLVWSMGITQHAHGADSVRAIAHLALMKEWLGRPGCGLMPIRGHSGVQGGSEMGAYSTCFPGGLSINSETANDLKKLWGFAVPNEAGFTTVEYLEAAGRGEIEAFWCIGGNFLETMPRPDRMAAALQKIPLRVHTDLVISSQMLVDPKEEVWILPARTRYEQRGGGTETSTERRVIFSPEIPGHQAGECREDWDMILDLARHVRPESAALLGCQDAAAIRHEIAEAVPSYRGIEKLNTQGDQFQWGGPHLCSDRKFPTDDGRAHFLPLTPPQEDVSGSGAFQMATRRGKQFNSMVQGWRDSLTGAERDHVLISQANAQDLGFLANQEVCLRSDHGEINARIFLADVAEGTVQTFWPESNPLLPYDRVDAGGGVPDYNVRIDILRRTQEV